MNDCLYVPDPVENFDEASKNETTAENATDDVEKVEITAGNARSRTQSPERI